MNCSILWIVREPIHEYFLSNQNQQYLQCAKSSRLDMLLTLKKKKYTWNLKFQMIKEKYQAKECQCSDRPLVENCLG